MLVELSCSENGEAVSPNISLKLKKDESVFNESREYLKSKAAGNYSDSESISTQKINHNSKKSKRDFFLSSKGKHDERNKESLDIKSSIATTEHLSGNQDMYLDTQGSNKIMKCYSEEVGDNYEKIKKAYREKVLKKKKSKNSPNNNVVMMINSESDAHYCTDDFTTDSSESDLEYEVGSDNNIIINFNHINDIPSYRQNSSFIGKDIESSDMEALDSPDSYSLNPIDKLNINSSFFRLEQGHCSESSCQDSAESYKQNVESFYDQYHSNEEFDPLGHDDYSPTEENFNLNLNSEIDFINSSFENIAFNESAMKFDEEKYKPSAEIKISSLNVVSSDLPSLLETDNNKPDGHRGSTSSQETEITEFSNNRFTKYKLRKPKDVGSIETNHKANRYCSKGYNSTDSESEITSPHSAETSVSANSGYSSFLNEFMSKKNSKLPGGLASISSFKKITNAEKLELPPRKN
ncbi:hypothetical protein AYI70_g6511 [Smittium culicis]|uniref:Uncharacterized protein n=1 Tax=Smittium culicis TaxID=133412 RepID=A0A1R1XPL4_9FUNG|nr:hypothetical protein AYI70_g6511 [Smittium culicis]